MANEMMHVDRQLIQSLDDVERAAQAMAASGYFQDAKQAAQAIVKVLAGHEMGFGPFASMNGIHIIQGRPAIGANLMAAAVKRSGRYNYRVLEMTDAACEIAFYDGAQECGRSRFTIEDARKAQTKNLDKYPRNMLFARAMSNGVKWYCPDVFNGSTVYTPEELGAVVNDDGVIEGEVIQAVERTPDPPAHWLDDNQTRARFWAWVGKQGLTNEEVHEALGVDSIYEFEGSKAAVFEAIGAYIDKRKAEVIEA